jgi:hypothetical protein
MVVDVKGSGGGLLKPVRTRGLRTKIRISDFLHMNWFQRGDEAGVVL